jgi:hypothetical protein
VRAKLRQKAAGGGPATEDRKHSGAPVKIDSGGNGHRPLPLLDLARQRVDEVVHGVDELRAWPAVLWRCSEDARRRRTATAFCGRSAMAKGELGRASRRTGVERAGEWTSCALLLCFNAEARAVSTRKARRREDPPAGAPLPCSVSSDVYWTWRLGAKPTSGPNCQ